MFFSKGQPDATDTLVIEGNPMREPEVSIITAAYNAEKYIAETIESVQKQTFSNWEYIIADNGSTDRTAEIIEQFLSDDRIRLVIEKEKGRGFARNAAFAHTRAEYIANIDADDLWSSDKLEKQVALLNCNPQVGLVYTGLRIIDEMGSTVGVPNTVGITQKPLQYLLTVKNPIAHSSVMIRREAFCGGKYQDEEIEEADELIVYLKTFLIFNEAGFIREPLTMYRVHRGSGLDRVSIRTFCREYQKGLDAFFQLSSLPLEVRGMKRCAYGTMYYLSASIGISFKKEPSICINYLIKSMVLRPSKIHLCLFQFVRLSLSAIT